MIVHASPFCANLINIILFLGLLILDIFSNQNA